MNTYEIKNAKIEYTNLGVSHTDHGILSFVIGLEYGGGGQGYGQLCLDTYDEAKKKRVPTMLGSSLLLGIDELFGVDWEDLKGLPCRAYATWGNIRAIGSFLEDSWLWFDEDVEEFKVTSFKEIKVHESAA
jgi:hypothetical protein